MPIDESARLEFDNVTVNYSGHTVLDNITFHVSHGARVAVVGPNGAGKSTLFKVLVGLVHYQRGAITIHGLPLHSHQDCIAYVPQREDVDWRFPLTVFDVVMMGRYGRLGWIRQPGNDDAGIVHDSLAQMGIADLANRQIGELSGGQQQRVFLARALAQQPHILLMDEPFTGVDAATQETTLELLEEIKKRDVTVLLSTHDLAMANQRFERVLLLNKKVVAYGEASQVFTKENVRQVFGGQVFFIDDTAVVDQCCSGHDHDQEAW